MAHNIFGRLVDVDRLHPQVRAPLKVLMQNAGDSSDLTCREWIKRMANRNIGSIQGSLFYIQIHANILSIGSGIPIPDNRSCVAG